MYPTNIKLEKINNLKAIKEKIINVKEAWKRQIKYILFNRKHLSKIIMIKLHI